jgi:hypothetical protein
VATTDEKDLDAADSEKAAPSAKAGSGAKGTSLNAPSKKKSKKKSAAEVQQELRDLSKGGEERPPVDLKKIYRNIGIVVVLLWAVAIIIASTSKGAAPYAYGAAGLLTVVGIGAAIWLNRYVKKTVALGAILKGADTEEGRKQALERLSSEFKKDDTQAVIAKAQLQMQDDPRAALATLEAVNLDKVMAPVAGQVRAMRAMIHLTLGETQEARSLADKLELGKQQEPKTRVMFAAVASEAWARTGQGKKAVDTLDLFNPEDPEMGDMRAQLWRARAFAYAATNDTKAVARALKKLAEINPHLLGMFVGQKKIHPLLEKEAKQVVMRMGVVPRKMVRQKM